MYLGIEIGGTKLQLGLGLGDGTIIALARAAVDAEAGADGIRRRIVELVPSLLVPAGVTPSQIHAVGFGFGGPVNAKAGTVTTSHQIAGWAGFDLVQWSRRELGWPAVIQNDADAAGLAEACFGAARGESPVFYITIGSGIGGGLIIDQQIFRGAGPGAAEIGHLTIPDAPDAFANGDRPRTVESLCSGWAIESFARQSVETSLRAAAINANDETRAFARQILDRAGGQLDQINLPLLATTARAGNRFAQEMIATRRRLFAWAVAQMIAIVCPRRIVIGGGASLIGDDLLFRPLREEVSRFVFPPFAGAFDIVPALLGETVVVHGALKIARDAIPTTSNR